MLSSRKFKNVRDVLAIILLVIASIAVSWATISFVYWLITLCFGIEWCLLHATGVWLILILINIAVNNAAVKFNVKK